MLKIQTEGFKVSNSTLLQLLSQEVRQDWCQDCAPGVQLHPQDHRRDYGQDGAPGVQLYPQDVRQNHAQEVQLRHPYPRDICRDHAQFFLS